MNIRTVSSFLTILNVSYNENNPPSQPTNPNQLCRPDVVRDYAVRIFKLAGKIGDNVLYIYTSPMRAHSAD